MAGRRARGGRAAERGGGSPRPNGSTFVAEHVTTPIVEDGRAIGAVITFRDVTARHKRDEQRSRPWPRPRSAPPSTRSRASPTTAPSTSAWPPRWSGARRHGARPRPGADGPRPLQAGQRRPRAPGGRPGAVEPPAPARPDPRRGVVARVGGEEFAMILPEADADEALEAAERVRRAIADAHFPEVGRMTTSRSGVCDIAHATTPMRSTGWRTGRCTGPSTTAATGDALLPRDRRGAVAPRSSAERLERQQALAASAAGAGGGREGPLHAPPLRARRRALRASWPTELGWRRSAPCCATPASCTTWARSACRTRSCSSPGRLAARSTGGQGARALGAAIVRERADPRAGSLGAEPPRALGRRRLPGRASRASRSR